jgi:hypothetical protein
MALLVLIVAIVIGLVLLVLIGRALWWFCEVAFPAIILFLMKHF